MKKSSRSRRTSAKKTTTRTSRKNAQQVLLFPFSFRRIILVTTCIALFVFVVTLGNNPGRQAVAGINITNGLFSQATVTLSTVENAVSYNIYYKKQNEKEYKNAVREINPSVEKYTVSYLTKGASYTYKISAVDVTGAEFWWSEEKPLDNLQDM